MKLLLDEDISHRIVGRIVEHFPNSVHVLLAAEKPKTDCVIFEYARLYDFVIVTFDEDFYDIQLLKGFPPKIVWLRFGNSASRTVVSKLIDNKESIYRSLLDSEVGIIEIY
ncbi:MAG: DUF5615 family PIN-like protein [Bacteroidetes bacterium]|nr:DUF5615 family PIN-like protein [Bacteroidota bacterium]MBS1540375.1 DUF5615 family PIN-like protein [Bacteroidota bacterium]